MQGFNHLSLKTKVFAFFGLLFFVYAVSTIYNFYLLNQFKGNSDPSDLVTKSIYSTSIAGTLISIGCLIFIMILFKRVIRPIDRLTEATQKIVQGDLSVHLDNETNDEIGKLTVHFDSMISQLRVLVEQCQSNTQLLHDSAKQLYDSSQGHEKESEVINSSIRKISAGAQQQQGHSVLLIDIVDSMVNRIHEIADLANRIELMSTNNARQSEEGMSLISETSNQVGYMEQISSQAAEDAGQLAMKTNEIDKIVNLISGIANQTNLLALNAAIEAARAGDQGKGFAVVAGEVRQLAEQSLTASKQIQEIIEDVRAEINKMVEVMAGGSLEVQKGSRLFGNVQSQYRDMREGILSIQNEIGRITHSADDLNLQTNKLSSMNNETIGILEINSAGIAEMAAGFEKQGETVREITATAENLTEVSSVLKKTVSVYHNRQ
ncbi:methyl-accepting chemotaxis protein [Mesobacillus subterraneus]|uniref:methyl-accepting chemotaxis protein n=1 Tax=Mesobacillus subterraneus TaxID=285983 RepID=UPI001CFE336D|nr:methyl-accepting chemotaxis protein [Mesobacillus subterraneus]WLR54344.1 methyl-accepting chemotaxis protein [Mesobacillus subterraneus]